VYWLEDALDGMNPGSKVSALKEAVAAVPNSARLNSDLSEALSKRGDKQGAIQEANEAIKLDPTQAIYHYDLADLLSDQGNAADALREYFAGNRLRDRSDQKYTLSAAWIAYKIKGLSDELRLHPSPWGVLISLDTQLVARKAGEASATVEVGKALDTGLPNIALYQRANWYGTVVQFQDEANARFAFPTIEKILESRNGLSAVQIDTWCPKAELSDLIEVNKHNVPLFKCAEPPPTSTAPAPK
jgi:tetratricopeptide (TPR) repeat protein